MISMLLGLAWAAEGSVAAGLGGRTSPESATQIPDGEGGELGEIEPVVMAWATAGVATTTGPWRLGVDGSAWVPHAEHEVTRLTLQPHALLAVGEERRVEVAGRYLVDAFPLGRGASSGRLEVLGQAEVPVGEQRLRVRVAGVDRHYPWYPLWSFRTGEVGGDLVVPGSGAWRASVGASVQANRGRVQADGEAAWGSQVRGRFVVGWAARTVDLELRVHPMVARAGDEDENRVPQLTPLGDYAWDADALSVGGFRQVRVDLAGRARLGAWSVRGRALGRLRSGAFLARSGGLDVGLDRGLGERLAFTATLGVLAADVAAGRGFVDVYGWSGLRWSLGSD
ncbi:MAG: hypothetical protein H6734_19480 [Alphaproteobacteria bacterium]|nr:hypothetical protein [Alphaproteobacteria bacterium]